MDAQEVERQLRWKKHSHQSRVQRDKALAAEKQLYKDTVAAAKRRYRKRRKAIIQRYRLVIQTITTK